MEHAVDREGRWEGLREVMAMAIPIITGSLSYTLMRFVDQWMVAKLDSEGIAFSAVGMAGLASFLMTCFFIGAIGCVSTFVSQSLGRGEKQDCARYAWQSVHVALSTAIVALVFLPLSRPIFNWLPHPAAVRELEVVYFRIRLLGFVFIVWQCALGCFFQAIKRPGITMWTGILANLLNMGLDYVLIFGKFGFPQWGVKGAAIATVAAQMTQVVILQAVFLNRRMDDEFGTRTAYRPDWVKIRELLRIGWPGGLTLFLDLLNWSAFSIVIVGMFGVTAMAAHTAAINLMHLAFLPALGLNQAIAPIVGQWIGRGEIPKAKARTYTTMKLAVSYMVSMGILLIFTGRSLIGFFFSQDPDVIALGHTLLLLAAVFQGFDAINIVLFGALRGAGDTRWMMFAAIVGGYFFFLPISLFLAVRAFIPLAWPFTTHIYWLPVGCGWEAVGAWIGATFYIIGFAGAIFLRFHGEKWRHIRIFERDRV